MVGSLPGFHPFSFTVYSNFTVEFVRGCASLKKNVRGCVILKKYKSQGKDVGCEQQGGKLLGLLSRFRSRIRPLSCTLSRQMQ
jgi:hypothetical protein